MATESPTPRRGSCLGRLVKLALVLLVIAGLFVVFLPRLISTGPGTRMVERLAAGSINGTLRIADLDLSWTGGQSVRGLRIDDAAGKPLANLDLSVTNGLLSLARGGWKQVDATVGGSVEIELRPDGTSNATSIAKPTTTAAPAPAAKGESRLPAGLDARIALAGLDVTLREQATGRVVKLDDLKGEAIVGTVRPITFKVAGASEFEGRVGSVAVDATATDLVRSDGAIAFAGAKVNATARIGSLALPLPEMLVEVKSLDATLTSDDLAKSVALDLESSATLNGNTPSSMTAKVVASELFRADGSVDFQPEKIMADVVARNVPTAVAEPFLKGRPVVLARDVGPTVDATIRFPGGGGDVAIKVDAANLVVDGTGAIDAGGGVVVTGLTARTAVQPALLQATSGLTSASAVPVVVESKRISIPVAAPGAAKPGIAIDKVAIEALTVRLPGSIELGRPAADGAARSLGTAQDLVLSVESPSLDREVHVTAGGTVEGGALAVDQRLTNLFSKDGSIDAAGAVAVGTIALKGIAPQRILNVLDPDTAAIARELLTAPVEATLTTAGGAERQARLVVASGSLRAEAEAVMKDRTLAVGSAKAVVPATSALLAALQKGAEKPVQVTPTALTAVLAPFTLNLDALDRALRDGPPLSAQIALADATFSNVPGTATPLGVNQFAGTATITPGAVLRVAFDGGARTTAAGASLASLSVKVDASRNQDKADAPLGLSADVAAPDIQVAAVEALLGRPAGSLSNLLGKAGSLSLAAAPQADGSIDLSAKPVFESLKGQIGAKVDGTLVTMQTSRVEMTLTQTQLDGLVTAGGRAPSTSAPAGRSTGPAGPDGSTLAFASPLGITATLADTVVDLEAFAGRPFDATRFRTTIDVTTTPVAMTLSTGQKVEFDTFTAKVATPRVDQGVTIAFDGRGAGGAVVSASGAVRNLVDARSTLQTAGATIDLKAQLKQFPTLLLDRLKDLDGLLVTTLGDLLEGSLTLQGLSQTAGTISASLSAANGHLDVPLATVREGLVVIEPSKPISGQLAITKPLRDRLLYRINPILADIRQTQQPIKLAIPAFAYPTDGNFTRLDGDVQLTFGAVEFDAGSQLLGLLELFNKKQAPVIPGLVEPLNVVIRKGQLTYQDFALRVGKDDAGWKHALVFSGDIDLVQTPPFARAIKSMYPAEGLARSIKELQNVPALSAVSVGVTFFGPLYDPAGNTTTLQRKLDVQIKPEDILKDKNIQKGIDDLLKKIR